MSMKVIYTGSGSAGPVIPLIALHEELCKEKEYKALWIGDEQGPVRSIVEKYSIPFITVHAFKLHRFLTWRLITEFFLGITSIPKIISALRSFGPDIILSVGGYVSVLPVIIGRCMGIPILIHQQDYLPGLANKLMAPFASVITCTFDNHRSYFKKYHVVKTGNPVRKNIREYDKLECTKILNTLGIDTNRPLVVIMGGGTGAEKINQCIYSNIVEITKMCEVVHLTGKGKSSSIIAKGYHKFEFLYEEVPCLLRGATVVISRAGLSSLTELSYLGKASIIIPMENTHQEANLKGFGDSIVAISESSIHNDLVPTIMRIVSDVPFRNSLEEKIDKILPKNSVNRIIEEIKKVSRNQ